MQVNSITILGVKITFSPKPEILAFIVNYLNSQKVSNTIAIYTPNPELIVSASENTEFKALLNSADVNLPDGIGLVWAAQLVRSSKLEVRSENINEKLRTTNYELRTLQRIPGIEFMEELVAIAAKKRWPVALIGGREGTALKALESLKQKYPGLVGWAAEPGQLRITSDELIIDNLENEIYIQELTKKISAAKIKLVFVGLGMHKQELFIQELAKHLSFRKNEVIEKSPMGSLTYARDDNEPVVLMSVGGAFDIFSGKIKRAPEIIQQVKLEWLWRLILQPWRITRQLKLLKFIYLAIRERFVVK